MRLSLSRAGLEKAGAVFARHPGFWLWLLPVLFLGFFFFYPLGAVFRAAASWSLTQGWAVDVLDQVVRPLWFTIWQASSSLRKLAASREGATSGI